MTEYPSDRFTREEWTVPEPEHNQLTEYNFLVLYPENLDLDPFVDIGEFTIINATEGVELKEDVQIGSHCSIYSKNTIDGTEGQVTIKSRAKIGAHSTIMPGVTIGEEATIGAHSLVKSDVPSGKTVCGVPATP